MAARRDGEEKCVYCLSGDVETGSHGSGGGRYRILTKMTGMWFSPDPPAGGGGGGSVSRGPDVSCRSCGARYAAIGAGPEDVRRLYGSVALARTALLGFRALFGDRRPDDIWPALEAAAEADRNTVHLFFAVGGRRAYLACKRSAGRLVAVSTEEAAAP